MDIFPFPAGLTKHSPKNGSAFSVRSDDIRALKRPSQRNR